MPLDAVAVLGTAADDHRYPLAARPVLDLSQAAADDPVTVLDLPDGDLAKKRALFELLLRPPAVAALHGPQDVGPDAGPDGRDIGNRGRLEVCHSDEAAAKELVVEGHGVHPQRDCYAARKRSLRLQDDALVQNQHATGTPKGERRRAGDGPVLVWPRQRPPAVDKMHISAVAVEPAQPV